jgi:hypothetical protein
MSFERVLRWALVSIAIAGLAAGILAYVAGRSGLAGLCWTLATAPVVHERDDEGSVYPRLAKVLTDGHGLSAMSLAHREIRHLARLLARVVEDLPSEKIDRYLVRDAQRMIEAIEALVRIHTAQEEEIYDAVVAR